MRTARLLAPFLLLVFAAPILAELQIAGETKVDEYTFAKFTAKGAADGSAYIWQVTGPDGKKLSPKSLWKQKDKLVFVGPAGTYTVSLLAVRFDPKTSETSIEEAETEVTIVSKVPPVPPVIQEFKATPVTIQKGGQATLTWSTFPPTAKVTVNSQPVANTGSLVVSPQVTTSYSLVATNSGLSVTSSATITVSDKPPDPPPSPAPINGSGFRVLIVYESAELAKLSAGQRAVIFGATTRDYLRSKSAKDTDNPDGAFRFWDKDVDASAESKSWQDALARAKGTSGFATPWILISNPSKGGGFEGPLPDDIAKTTELLKKYGD